MTRQYDVEREQGKRMGEERKQPPDRIINGFTSNKAVDVDHSVAIVDRQRRPSGTASVTSRGNWGSKWEFLLSCVGLSVGIGNIWRFPYLAYKNGGGAFLIPYLIMLFLAGRPMYFMELAFGQFATKGPLSIWLCSPLFKGVGVAMVIVSFIITIYYNILMAYTVYYMASSFQKTVPWMECNPEWADMATCYVRNAASKVADNVTAALYNETSNVNFNNTMYSVDDGFSPSNLTMNNSTALKMQSASQQYWERYVLGLSPGIEEIGTVKWDLALCLLFSWIIVALCLIRGIKTSGKVVYFAATFPYVILIILLVTGLLQEGAMKGVVYFFVPDWKKLLEIQVWKEAAGQMFFSLGVSMGSLIMYSSYNPFRNNVYRDALIVSVLDTFTSIIAGIVIFSVLGSMAHELNLDISEVVKAGPGLAFVTYPEALSRLPIPQLWCVLFFLMLFILGLDSEFAIFENILTSLSDEIPILRKHKKKFLVFMACVCFLLGLPCVTNGGQYILQLMDDYGGSTSLIFVAIFECIAIMWVYGVSRFSDDVQFMLGSRPSIYLKVTWTFCAPIILMIIFVYTLVTHSRSKYGDYEYPFWSDAVGWLLALLSMVQIPLFAVIAIWRQPGPTLLAKIRQSAKPDPDWGPVDAAEKEAWCQFKEQKSMAIELPTRSEKRLNGADNPAFN